MTRCSDGPRTWAGGPTSRSTARPRWRRASSSTDSTTALFFANASYVKGRVREAIRGAPTEPRWLVLDAEGMTQIDASGLDALKTLVDELDKEGIGFAVARLKSAMAVRLDAVKLTEQIGQEHFYGSVSKAVDACRGHQPS